MYVPVLRAQAQRQLKQIGHADLVIGLPSYQSKEATLAVAKVALSGIQRYYPGLRTVLVNADAGLQPDTRHAIRALAATNGNKHAGIVVSDQYTGTRGWGNAVGALLDAALALDARAIVILDSVASGADPDWVAALAELILSKKADLVLPRYRYWSQPEGLLNDLILYPLFRSLWGQSIRYPIATDFAIGPELATALLDEDVWGTSVATGGMMPWLASFAVVSGWNVAQGAVGAKQKQAGSGKDIALAHFQGSAKAFQPVFSDTLSVMFSQAYRYRHCWQKLLPPCSLPTLTRYAPEVFPYQTHNIDTSSMLDELALGWIEYRSLWQKVLTPAHLSQLEAIAALPPDSFYFPADLWARIIYDFVTVYNYGELDPNQVVAALLPVYHGRVAAYSHEVAGLAAVGREGTVAAQAVEFEESRKYFKMRWKSYQAPYFRPGFDDRPVL
jgi:hypothetical protein